MTVGGGMEPLDPLNIICSSQLFTQQASNASFLRGILCFPVMQEHACHMMAGGLTRFTVREGFTTHIDYENQ